MKEAPINGVTRLDGAYLAEVLLCEGYETNGMKGRNSLFNTDWIDHRHKDPHEPDRRFILHQVDMTDSNSLIRFIQQVQRDEMYNLAEQRDVAVCFEKPKNAANSDALGAGIGTGEAFPLLLGIDCGALWPGAGDPAEGVDEMCPRLYGENRIRPQMLR